MLGSLKSFFALAFVSIGLSIAHMPAVAADTLNLREAFRLAIDGPPLVELRRGGIEAAQEDVEVAKWKRFPTVTAENGQFIGHQSVTLTNSSQNTATWRVQQPLWTGGKIDTEIDGMGLRKQAALCAALHCALPILIGTARLTVALSTALTLLATTNTALSTTLARLVAIRGAIARAGAGIAQIDGGTSKRALIARRCNDEYAASEGLIERRLQRLLAPG